MKILFMRKERDSNPRYGHPYTRFPGVPLQPLEHLSFEVMRRYKYFLILKNY